MQEFAHNSLSLLLNDRRFSDGLALQVGPYLKYALEPCIVHRLRRVEDVLKQESGILMRDSVAYIDLLGNIFQ